MGIFLFPVPLASFLFSAIYKASSDNHFVVLNFFFCGMVLAEGTANQNIPLVGGHVTLLVNQKTPLGRYAESQEGVGNLTRMES